MLSLFVTKYYGRKTYGRVDVEQQINVSGKVNHATAVYLREKGPRLSLDRTVGGTQCLYLSCEKSNPGHPIRNLVT